MKITNEIKKMSAVELLDTFASCGNKKNNSVNAHQDHRSKIITLFFEDKAIEICGGDVSIVDYYILSDSISNILERSTRNKFKNWIAECNDWYREYAHNCHENGNETKTKMEWVEDVVNTELTLWDGDLDYELNLY